MLFEQPKTTEELWKRLDKKLRELPKDARDAFLLDLMKFSIDWQFQYMAYEQVGEESKESNPPRRL